jgi:hypothetical protein
METVDPLDQLAMSLAWEEEYTDEYKRRVLWEAIKQVAATWQSVAWDKEMQEYFLKRS